MKLQLNQTLKTRQGEPIVLQDGKPRTMCDAIIDALDNPQFSEKKTGAEKHKINALALRILAGDPVEVTAEEVAQIKEAVGIGYGPLVVGQIYDAVESVE